MAKDHFQVAAVTSLQSIAAGGRIHVIGVCGVAMAQLAVLLAESGYNVSGSDKEFYEPMGSLLKNSAVKTYTGYSVENVPPDCDLVVIGNALSYGNPEVDAVEKNNLPYTCFPKILEEVIIGKRHSIVVTGTHGKSTTSAMIAYVLNQTGRDPSYFIGGIVEGLPSSLNRGGGAFAVLEGDEYDSAFFAKVPKFSFYHPDTCIVNAVEFDHADIYPDLQSINREFDKLVLSLPAAGKVICCIDTENVRGLLKEWRAKAKCEFITFGTSADCDYRITARTTSGFSQEVTCQGPGPAAFAFQLNTPGEYNAKNGLAALIAADRAGIPQAEAVKALAGFSRVRRRQEVRFQSKKLILIEDFAHHPTAVNETIRAVREAFPARRLWAVFEPRSNTSRRKVFQQDYIKAFSGADRVVLCNVVAREADAGLELIDVESLSNRIAQSGTTSVALADAKSIADYLLASLAKDEVVVVMSNGSFGGLIAMLLQRLAEYREIT